MDKYEKLRVLGRGKYGTIHLIRRKSDGKQFVLKRVPTKALCEKDREASVREAEILLGLKHPNIVACVDTFVHNEEAICCVLDYCERGDLHSKIQGARTRHEYIREDQVLDWLIQIALALEHIHKLNIVHRDLKTHNIFVTSKNLLKLGDFGFARTVEGDGTTQVCMSVVGTPPYMSPEIIQYKPYDVKTDVWSLGCILYEMCALRPAFDASDLNGLIQRIAGGTYAPIPSHYSKELRILLRGMLERDPQRRPGISDILKRSFIRLRMNRFVEEARAQAQDARTGDEEEKHIKHDVEKKREVLRQQEDEMKHGESAVQATQKCLDSLLRQKQQRIRHMAGKCGSRVEQPPFSRLPRVPRGRSAPPARGGGIHRPSRATSATSAGPRVSPASTGRASCVSRSRGPTPRVGAQKSCGMRPASGRGKESPRGAQGTTEPTEDSSKLRNWRVLHEDLCVDVKEPDIPSPRDSVVRVAVPTPSMVQVDARDLSDHRRNVHRGPRARSVSPVGRCRNDTTRPVENSTLAGRRPRSLSLSPRAEGDTVQFINSLLKRSEYMEAHQSFLQHRLSKAEEVRKESHSQLSIASHSTPTSSEVHFPPELVNTGSAASWSHTDSPTLPFRVPSPRASLGGILSPQRDRRHLSVGVDDDIVHFDELSSPTRSSSPSPPSSVPTEDLPDVSTSSVRSNSISDPDLEEDKDSLMAVDTEIERTQKMLLRQTINIDVMRRSISQTRAELHAREREAEDTREFIETLSIFRCRVVESEEESEM